MRTYSHFLITALIGDRLKSRARLRLAAFLTGSVAPDVPLFLLTIGYYFYRRFTDAAGSQGLYGPNYDNLFYNNPIWITSHNFFHAPLIVVPLALVGLYGWRRGRSWGAALFWFSTACALHTVIDVFTHHADGPLLLFPLDTEYRFASPVSYWHPAFYGKIFAALETLADLVIAAYLATVWLRRKRVSRVPESVISP